MSFFIKNGKRKRISTLTVTLLVLLFTVFGSVYIASEAGHDCRGENCPVCECMQRCRATLERAGIKAPVFLVEFMPAELLFEGAVFEHELFVSTPVSRKIRLND
ncbi:MAG: hypothetical protein K6E19_03800 [Lachnospiraceae bacterium]|nr:hypothetical protein [Lachnospiraceae bacterium]